MKYIILILSSFIFHISSSGQTKSDNTSFNWTDKEFKIGVKRTMHIRFFRMEPDTAMDSWTYLSLDTIADFVKRNQYLKIRINIYEDPQGSPKHNLTLTNAHAQVAWQYLMAKGVDTNRYEIKGMGSTNPIFPMSEIDKMKTKEEKNMALQIDRRTEVVITSIDFRK